jgi:hypothetical protein
VRRDTKAFAWALLAAATAAVTLLGAVPASAAEPVTAAADGLRTGWYPDEAQLTPQLLEGGGFGRVFDTPIQGQVYAQPLVSGNTLLAATEGNWIYGIDPRSGAIRWQRNVGTPWNSADVGCTDLQPHVGITGTPVIDPATGIAYFFSKTYASGSSGPAVWNMHAVDLSNGAEVPGFPVPISGEAQNLPGVSFDPTQQLQRPALLLMNGVVYAAFGSHCDNRPYQGWVVGVSTSGQISAMWASAPEGGAIWQAGGGLVSDGEGQILFASGNSFGPTPAPTAEPPEDLSESVARLSVQAGGDLKATDFFSPFDREQLDEGDLDLGSGAPLGLPSPYFGTPTVPHLMVEVGKQGIVYLLNREDLGGLGQGPEEKDNVLQEVNGPFGVWGSLAAWPGDGGYVYVPGDGGLEMLKYGTSVGGEPELSLATTHYPEFLGFGSGSPMVTSNGATDGSGIAWISQCSNPPGCEGSTLNAYAAVPVGGAPNLLWRGAIGVSTKFARPDASGGRVYVGTHDGQLLGFGATHHTLAVALQGGGGSVRSNVPGIECGPTCAHSFADGAEVALTATPAAQFEFTGWSGGGCSGTGGCTVTMYSDQSVTATFAPIPSGPRPGRPGTKIAKATIDRKARRATFRFLGIGATTGFQCELIRRGARTKRPQTFSSCASPKAYRHLKPGRYVFRVRALGSTGPDPTPATREFKI